MKTKTKSLKFDGQDWMLSLVSIRGNNKTMLTTKLDPSAGNPTPVQCRLDEIDSPAHPRVGRLHQQGYSGINHPHSPCREVFRGRPWKDPLEKGDIPIIFGGGIDWNGEKSSRRAPCLSLFQTSILNDLPNVEIPPHPFEYSNHVCNQVSLLIVSIESTVNTNTCLPGDACLRFKTQALWPTHVCYF